ncbi:calcium-binding protein [Vreelandella salicampi]|uniref:DUF4214 domain-containing protein n=1 Tax=Vreelandella salicampi TaxID=1449798 RepID=A0A7Z0LJW5_9GAMM|nr:calcium-binding protein [Halomonas salicampi]NYS60341.1 DUF4214 domain-containing protein [Halomonas salicampi]
MAGNYNSPEEAVQAVTAAYGNKNSLLDDAVSRILQQTDDPIVSGVSQTAGDFNSGASNSDIFIAGNASGQRGTSDNPLQVDGSGRGGQGQVLGFEADEDEGYTVDFNTVERVILGSNQDDVFTISGDENTTVEGGAGNDTITASGGDDSITGGAGNDAIEAGEGNDSIYGGAGDDVAVFAGNEADYTIEQDGAVTMVTNNETGDVNEVTNVETLTFDDGSQAVEQSSDVQALATLYNQIFSFNDARDNNGEGQADLEGLQWWSDRVEEGTSLGQVALSMINSDEAGNKLDALDLETSEGIQSAIELLYTDVLGRATTEIDEAGRDYWVAQAEQGASLEDIATSFVSSDEFDTQNVDANDWDFLL